MEKEVVLLIEDERAWQRELRRILEEGGYQVCVVDNYEAALEAVRQQPVKGAVVDVSLIPGDAYDRQGLQFMVEAGIPVVCVSGYLTDEEVTQLLRNGHAEWFFAKQSFAGKEKRFLDAVDYSLSVPRDEIDARWASVRHLFPRGE